jgi:tetratricopeptide (TPR) repeat protein
VQSPSFSRFEPIPAGASADGLEKRADELRAEKQYFSAFDYYRAALAKAPHSAVLHNKLGVGELLTQRFREAKKDFEYAIRLDPHYSAAYNNLGVLEYALNRNGKAIKQYQKALTLQPQNASYYSNLGTAYFAKKEWVKANDAYVEALNLDPEVFDARNETGIAGRIASPDDRAHFSYVLAKLYAKQGLPDRSLEYLRRAIEEGYKKVDEVYTDVEFSQLRKDPRFLALMANRPVSIPE